MKTIGSCLYLLGWFSGFISLFIGLLVPYLIEGRLPWPFHKLRRKEESDWYCWPEEENNSTDTDKAIPSNDSTPQQ